MKHFTIEEIQGWDRFCRANFVNSLSGFKPVSLIASQDDHGNPNLAIFSNIVHVGADPALIAFINRPREAAPHTIGNIESTGHYTINHIHSDFMDKAHQTSAKYPAGVNEFAAVGLTEERKADFPVPFVLESHIQYALELSEIIPIRQNGTFLVVGKLLHAFVQRSIIADDGYIDLSKAGSVVSGGIDGYYSVQPLARFAYAKAGR
ncbi:MAG: flavin oxidoreductase [Bacteroidetes bacterium]|nr:flavin oxidoreductase [Bacteroidota bacterium]